MKHTITILLMCLCCMSAQAQRVTAQFHETSMSEALIEIERQCQDITINFIYDELEDFSVTEQIQDSPVPVALRRVVGFYPIRLTRQGNTYYAECVQKDSAKVTGRIIDQDGAPLPYVNVVLLNPADSAFINGGVSNENGDVVIPCNQEEVVAKVSCIGYKTIYRRCAQGALGNIQMAEDAIQLNGVKVKANMAQYKMTQGGMSVQVQHSMLSQVGNAEELLSLLPRITVDANGQVEMFGKGTPEIYINNRKMLDVRELQRLKSTDIKEVEVVTAPGAQYNAEVKGVIRIITIRPQGEGLSLRTEDRVQYDGQYLGGHTDDYVRYRKGGLEVFGSVYSRSRSYTEDNHIQQLMQSQQTVRVDQNMLMHSRIYTSAVESGLNWDINDRHSVGASYEGDWQLSFRGKVKNGTQDVYLDDELQGQITSDYMMKGGKNPRHVANAYYVGKAGKLGIDANASFLWSNESQNKSVEERSLELSSQQVDMKNSQKAQLQAGKLILSYPIAGAGQVSLGSELSHTKLKGKTHNYYISNEDQLAYGRGSKINEKHLAWFGELTVPIEQWQFNVGIRYEVAKYKYKDEKVYVTKIDVNDIEPSYYLVPNNPSKFNPEYAELTLTPKFRDWFPSASISTTLFDVDTQLSYAYKTQRPSYHSLRNEVQYDNRYCYEGGNPLLRPSKSHCLDLNVNHSWWSLAAGYSYTHDAILWFTSLYPDQEDVTYTCNENFDHLEQAYVSVVLSPKFGWYQPVFELDYEQEWFDAKQYASAKPSYKPHFVFDLKNRLILPHDLNVILSLRQNTDNYSGFQVVRHTTRLNAQIIKSFCNKALTVNLRLNDLLRQKERWTMYGIQTKGEKDCYNYTRNVTLTVTYNFNTSKSKYKGTGAGQAEMRRL